MAVQIETTAWKHLEREISIYMIIDNYDQNALINVCFMALHHKQMSGRSFFCMALTNSESHQRWIA